MRRLIWGFAGRIYYIVGNHMTWLNYIDHYVYLTKMDRLPISHRVGGHSEQKVLNKTALTFFDYDRVAFGYFSDPLQPPPPPIKCNSFANAVYKTCIYVRSLVNLFTSQVYVSLPVFAIWAQQRRKFGVVWSGSMLSWYFTLDTEENSKTCLQSGHLKRRPTFGFQDWLPLMQVKKYCRMHQWVHSAIRSTFIKIPFAIKIFV